MHDKLNVTVYGMKIHDKYKKKVKDRQDIIKTDKLNWIEYSTKVFTEASSVFVSTV